MILRQICVRQGRNLRTLNRSRILTRFSSTDSTPVDFATPSRTHNTDLDQTDIALSNESAVSVPADDEISIAQQAWENQERSRKTFRSLGTTVTKGYQPEDLIRNPPRPSNISLEILLASQTHLGHSTSRWNPQNSKYIFGIREGIHIISLDVTAAHLRRAARVVEEVAARGGLILFVGTRPGQKRAVVRAAELAKGCHLFERWIPGSLTNGQQILSHCDIKVVNALDEELPTYKPFLRNRPVLKPDLVVCLNPLENEVLLHECALNNVPTIGVIDTDADPTRVTYQIPANDDSLRSIQFIVGVLGRAGEAGQKRRLEDAMKGKMSYEPVTDKEIRGNQLKDV